MSGSFIFYCHLLGFALLATSIFGGWILNFKFLSEQDAGIKIYLGSIMRTFWLLFPLGAVVLLVTGIGNIFNLYYGTPQLWYQQGWLVIKIVLFGVMLVNGNLFGPALIRKRLKMAQHLTEQTSSPEEQKQFKELNKQVTWFFIVQTVVLLGIVFFSAFGTSKHPGYL